MNTIQVGETGDARGDVLSDEEIADIATRIDVDGYALIRNAVDPEYCASVGAEVVREYERLNRAGWKFKGGGRFMGHLAFRPSGHGHRITSILRRRGFVTAAERFRGAPLGVRACVGNMNLPGSRTQEIHQDGYGDVSLADDPIVFNVLLTETTPASGATDIIPGSQGHTYRSLHSSGAVHGTVKFAGSPGDLLIRRSAVWHRGTTNSSAAPRPMFGVIMQATGTPQQEDPLCDGPIEFFGNRFYGRFALLREVAALYGAPMLHLKRTLSSQERD